MNPIRVGETSDPRALIARLVDRAHTTDVSTPEGESLWVDLADAVSALEALIAEEGT